jgi:hypothetical protein
LPNYRDLGCFASRKRRRERAKDKDWPRAGGDGAQMLEIGTTIGNIPL